MGEVSKPIELLPVDDEHATNVCKIGQGHKCCRYLSMSGGGWSCLKWTRLRVYLDSRVASETITARGDNCEGRAA